MTYTVYGIRLEGTVEVRYVGFTKLSLEARLAKHLRGQTFEASYRPLIPWLLENRDCAEAFPIAKCATEKEARAIESVTIALCLRLEHRLLNQRKLPVSACPLGRNSAQRRTRMYAPPALGGSLEYASESISTEENE